MPFDGTNFPPPRRRARPDRGNDNAATILIIVIAVSFLVMPIPLGALTGMIRYASGH